MENEKIIFQWKVPEDYPNFSRHDDIAEEYRVYQNDEANGGVIVEAKYNGEWIVNPWSTRPLVRHLLQLLQNRQPSVSVG